MADPLRTPPLETDFSVEPPTTAALPGNPADLRELEPGREQAALVNAAETIGSAAGKIRNKVQSGLEVVRRHTTEQRSTVGELSETVREHADEFAEEGRRRLQHWGNAAQDRIERVRRRTAEFSRERPAELILAIGAVAMIAGVLLRLWRSNHD